MTAGQGTITQALRYTWTLFRTGWRRIWGALALNALAGIVVSAGVFAFKPSIVAAGLVASLFTGAMLFGAIYQIALKPPRGTNPASQPAHHGVQWRAVEWRLVGASLLVGVFTTFMVILGLLVWGSVVSGVLQAKGIKAYQADTPEQLIAAFGWTGFSLAVLAFILLGLIGGFIRLRLALSWPATVAEDGVRVLRTWKLTHGRVLQILAAMIVIWLPFTFLVDPLARSILVAGGLPTNMNEVANALKAGVSPPTVSANAVLAAAIIDGGLKGFVRAPLLAGVAAYFYLLATGAAPEGVAVPKAVDR